MDEMMQGGRQVGRLGGREGREDGGGQLWKQ